VSHQLMGGTRDWDDDAAPCTAEGGDAQDRAVATVVDEVGRAAESSDGADTARPGRRQSSSEGSSRQPARLETVSEDRGPQVAPAKEIDGRQPGTGLDIVPELDGPRPGSALPTAHWPHSSASSDERRGVSIEMVSRGEAGQHARETEGTRRVAAGSESSAASSGDGGTGQRQTRSWFFAPSERSHGDEVCSSTSAPLKQDACGQHSPCNCSFLATASAT